VISILVSTAALVPGDIINTIPGEDMGIGALVSFTGYVRDFNQGHTIEQLYLEHFPGMTEKALHGIAEEARQRWPLHRIFIQHRVGSLKLGEPIVMVAVASAHREDAFLACTFIMDYLKTRAPFWKKEASSQGDRWVAGSSKDQEAAKRWERSPKHESL
jgi:molybdopterin synthase catalytic subunit